MMRRTIGHIPFALLVGFFALSCSRSAVAPDILDRESSVVEAWLESLGTSFASPRGPRGDS
jgi:hypothetical protein